VNVRLLVTRPQPDAERTAAALAARGHDVQLAPLLRVVTVDCTLPAEPWAAVLLTSAAAARAIAQHRQCAILLPLPAFAVGRRTAEAATAAGFVAVQSADGDQHDLVALVRARLGDAAAPLLYVAGEDRAGNLADDLASAGVRVVTIVTYRAIKAERFPPDVAAALAAGTFDGALHFSRRSAEAYLDCAANAGLREAALAPTQFCLSEQVAAPLRVAGAPAVSIAARPDEAAMLALVEAAG